MAAERTLAVHPALTTLFPHGLVRGTTVLCRGHAATSMAMLLAVGAVDAGAWVGVAALPTLGVQACREAGLSVGQMVAVREPTAGFDDGVWGQVLATLIDGFEIIVFGAAARVRSGTARRLQARVQARGAVIVLVGSGGSFSCDQQLTADIEWIGLGEGHGHLQARRVQLTLEGRRLQRPRRDALWYPGPSGIIEPVAEPVINMASDQVAPSAADDLALRRTG
jgi:hypothetical protein